MPHVFNIAQYLPQRAREAPDRAAIVCEHAPDARGRTRLTFGEMNSESDQLAWSLRELGLQPGQRTLVMLRPGLDFITLTFALFKLGAVPVLIDPGMGRKNLLTCIKQVRPEAFIGVSLAHAARVLVGKEAFATSKLNITAGRRWFWGGPTLERVRELGAKTAAPFPLEPTTIESPAAILFTTGSTGIPKGVLYLHGMFGAQVELIRKEYGIEPGEVDLPAFPLFALFSTALGTTCIIPDMDPTRPAQCDPAKIVAAIQKHKVTYTFGSPSIWKRVGPYCEAQNITLPTLKRILMAGAPVRGEVLAPFAKLLPNGDTFIPYGATESLPIASIRGSEVLNETWALTRQGKGYCVGRPLAGVDIRVLKIPDSYKLDDIHTSIDAWSCSPGEIGEICVAGPQVTREYFEMPAQTAGAKILARVGDQVTLFHRLGDMGYLDDQGRLWFCGRKAHRVTLDDGTELHSVCVEALFEEQLSTCYRNRETSKPVEFRTALVMANQKPFLLIENLDADKFNIDRNAMVAYIHWNKTHPIAQRIRTMIFPSVFPTDVRHNAKINREELGKWVEEQLRKPRRIHVDF